MTTPAKVHALFSALEYLETIPLSVLRRWSPKDLAAAERWAHAWDLWLSDVSDHPLPKPPDVLRPYLPSDIKNLGRRR